MKSNMTESSSRDIAEIAAGLTTAMFALVNLMVDKQLITEDEVRSSLNDLLVKHQLQNESELSSAAVRHLLSLLSDRKSP